MLFRSVYGTMKRNQDPKADDIESLMHRYPLLRVAYIDSIRLNRSGESVYYSCLVKSDRKGGIQEIYRVRLPDNPIIGEGKPENQNHAMIFTRGEFVQVRLLIVFLSRMHCYFSKIFFFLDNRHESRRVFRRSVEDAKLPPRVCEA